MNILTPPHKIIATAVTSYAEIKKDADEMVALLDQGVGRRVTIAVSHAQVSREPKTFFVLHREFKPLFYGRRVIVNCKITGQKDYETFQEACLSFPNAPVIKTRRFREVEVVYQVPNSRGELSIPRKYTYSGLAAVIIQHEMDHAIGKNIYGEFMEYNREPEKETVNT